MSRTSPEGSPASGSSCGKGLQFRRLGVEDAEKMAGLESICFSLPWTQPQCRGALAQKAFAAFGLFADEHLSAYISFYHAAGEMEILNLAVEPARRRQGLGRRILLMALQVARKMGMQRVSLEVRQGNAAAIALYESAGFTCTGRRSGYYPDTGEDALIHEFQCDPKAEG